MNKFSFSLTTIALAMVLGGCTVVLPNGAGAQYHGRNANIGVQLGGQGGFPVQQGLVCPPGSAWDGRGCLVTNPGLIQGGLIQNQNCRNSQQFINGRWLCPM